MDLSEAIANLRAFTGRDLTSTLSQLEVSLQDANLETCHGSLAKYCVNEVALTSAGVVKRLAGQINVVVHALGILLCLPKLLQPGEAVEYVSLGAGNTGKPFDLETNQRIAEFKFIHWQGGPEVIRQNALFKDFYLLAEHESAKKRFLYLLGTAYPLEFLKSGRSMSSVLSRNVPLQDAFMRRYPNCKTVRDYYLERQDAVAVLDVSPWVPGLFEELGGTEVDHHE